MKKQSLFKKIFLFFRPFWKSFAIILTFLFVGQLVGAVAPLLLGKTIDAVKIGSIHNVILFISLSATASILQTLVLARINERYQVKNWDSDINRLMSTHSVEKLFNYSIGQHTNEHSGVKQTIVNKGQSALIQLINSFTYNIIPNSLQILATLIILAYINWQIALLALVFVLWYCLTAYRLNIRFFPDIDLMRKKKQGQSKTQSELFRNTTLVISEAQEDYSTSEFDKSFEVIDSEWKKLWLRFDALFYRDRSIVVFGRYFLLAYGVYLVWEGNISIGIFVALVSWAGTIFGNLTMIMNQQRQTLFQIVEVRKFFELLEIAPDLDVNLKGIILEDLKGEIAFKNVSFTYPARVTKTLEESEEAGEKELDHAVSGINLIIPAGAKVGFVGLSGSGKSTIINLLRRYYDPTLGDILIDGVNLKDINLKWLRSNIGNVEQKIDLFDRSIKDNILFGLPENLKNVPDAELSKAITDASLDDFISKLKYGLDTLIGEGGIKVSGGERQRIGIARALIKNPKILIFDEATSALDAHNEKLIHDAINRGAKGRTTVIVAHRLSTIIDADKIFVVDDGKIVGEGTHTELSENCPQYQQLIKHQVVEI